MLCFYILLVKIEKKVNCLFLKYNGVISFLVLKTIQIDIFYMFLCSLFKSYDEIDNIYFGFSQFS